MSGGEIAGLIAAGSLLVLVLFLGFVLVKVGGLVDETSKLVAGVAGETVPLIRETTTSVVHVNAELTRIDTITANVEQITTNVAGLSSVFSSTVGTPMIKVAATAYGAKKAVTERRRKDIGKRIRSEMKAKKN
jgi:uncharacterized protein YoxC